MEWISLSRGRIKRELNPTRTRTISDHCYCSFSNLHTWCFRYIPCFWLIAKLNRWTQMEMCELQIDEDMPTHIVSKFALSCGHVWDIFFWSVPGWPITHVSLWKERKKRKDHPESFLLAGEPLTFLCWLLVFPTEKEEAIKCLTFFWHGNCADLFLKLYEETWQRKKRSSGYTKTTSKWLQRATFSNKNSSLHRESCQLRNATIHRDSQRACFREEWVVPLGLRLVWT